MTDSIETKAFADPANPGGFHHIPALDGVRGLAILLVLGNHLLWANSQAANPVLDFFEGVRGSLWIGVNLFFALSGYLITGILWDTIHKPSFFANFYARRALRIFPLYYGVLLTLLALTRVLHFEWNNWQYLYLTYTSNLAFGMGGLGLPHVAINHFWSLQVEEQFYCVWPLVVYYVRNIRRLLIGAVAACTIVLGIRTTIVFSSVNASHPGLTGAATYCCADNLLFGCILALMLRTGYRQKVLNAAPGMFAFCAVCLFTMAVRNHGLTYTGNRLQPTLGATLLGIGSAAFIAITLVPGSQTAAIFRLSFLRFFGKYSYGIYIFHYTISDNLTAPVRSFLLIHTHSKLLSVLGGGIVVAALSVVVALLSYHLYEKHFLHLKRFFSYRAIEQPTSHAIAGTTAANLG